MRILLVAVVAASFGVAGLAAAQSGNEGAPLGTHPEVPTTAVAPPDQPVAGDAGHGGRLFVAVGCYECHGYVGQGSVRTGPALAPRVIPMSAFVAQLRKPMDKMPAYTPVVLSDTDTQDIYAFIKSIPPSPALADIALLNQ